MPVPRCASPCQAPRDSAPENPLASLWILPPRFLSLSLHWLSLFSSHCGAFACSVSLNLECSFPRPSCGWFLPIHLAPAQPPPPLRGPPTPSVLCTTEMNKEQRLVSCELGAAAQLCRWLLSTSLCMWDISPHQRVRIRAWALSPLQPSCAPRPLSPPSLPRHYSDSCGRDTVTGQPI